MHGQACENLSNVIELKQSDMEEWNQTPTGGYERMITNYGKYVRPQGSGRLRNPWVLPFSQVITKL